MSRYHPLPSSGKLSLIDLAKEKLMINEWDTPTSKISLVGLATEQSGYGNPTTLNRDTDINPYPIINSIEKTPYSITGLRITETPIDYTGWYGYNHLTEYDSDWEWEWVWENSPAWYDINGGTIQCIEASSFGILSFDAIYPDTLTKDGDIFLVSSNAVFVCYEHNFNIFPIFNFNETITRAWIPLSYGSNPIPFGKYLKKVEIKVTFQGLFWDPATDGWDSLGDPVRAISFMPIRLGIKSGDKFNDVVFYRPYSSSEITIISSPPYNTETLIATTSFFYEYDYTENSAVALIESQLIAGTGTTWVLMHPIDNHYLGANTIINLDSCVRIVSVVPIYTFAQIAPVVRTDYVQNSTTTSVTILFTVRYGGKYKFYQAGVCYKLESSSGDPVYADGYVSVDGYSSMSSVGEFTVTISNLTPDTLYKFRAFLLDINANMTYGNTIIESPLMLPTVITYDATEITLASAKFGGTVERSGGRPVQNRGVVWQYNYLSQWPVYAFDETEYVGYGLGEFFVSVYDFEPYVIAYRAFAVTAFGVGYGETKVLYLQQPEGDPPTVVTTTPYNIGDTTATAGGNVTDEGDGTVTRKGIAWVPGNWEILPHPNITYHSEDGSGLGSFTSYMASLTPGSYYLMRAYAENEYGVGLGETKGFMTTGDTPELLPTVTTSPITNITSTTATCGGNVIDDGAKPVFKRGCLWIEASAGRDPIEGDYVYVSGSGEGSFTAYLTGLDGETNYRVVAFAESMVGISYGIVRTILREIPDE